MTCPSCGAESLGTGAVCAACGDPLPLGAGSIVASRYEIETRLGKGGMGTVYRARDRMLGEEVALKVLNPGLGTTREMAERFRSEIRLARKVTHRNVCRIHDYGEEGPLRFISMQFIEGEDLRQVLRRQGRLPPEEAFEVAIQTAEGLQAIHDEGIIHRDLKSPNIMRDTRGVARLMDFGIAKRWQEGEGGGLTLTGQIVGTPEYMSPEQVRGEKVDFRSDVYALGVVVFELFTGQLPFKGETAMATIMMQLEEPPPLDGEKARAIPAPVVPLLRKALAKNPLERYDSARQMSEALRAARAASVAPLSSAEWATSPSPAPTLPQSGWGAALPPGVAASREAPTARAVSPPSPGRTVRAGWWLGLAATSLIAGGLGWYWLGRRPPTRAIEDLGGPGQESSAETGITTSTTFRPGPSISDAPPGPSASSSLPSSSPAQRPPIPGPPGAGAAGPGSTQLDGDLRALDQLTRENPEAALARLEELERQHPGHPDFAERRTRLRGQLTTQGLERARGTLTRAEAEQSLDLYARGIKELSRVVESDPGSVEARQAMTRAIEAEARLKVRQALVSFVLSGTTVSGAARKVVNAPPGMGEAPPGVIIKKAEATPIPARIVIETEPAQAKKGEDLIVRYYLDNQTTSPLHLSDALVQTVIGEGATTGGRIQPRTRVAEPRGRALLLESRDAWRLDPGTDWKTTLRVVLVDGTVLTGSLETRR